MKKIIIVIVITVFSAIAVNAQKSANYVSLANSNNDTLQYLNNNFIIQKAKYLGQPLSKIFNDLELKIVDCYSIDYVQSGFTAEDVDNIAGLNLGIYNRNEYNTYLRDRFSYGKRYTLSINTRELIPRSEYETLIFKNPENIDADVKVLFSGSNYVVDSIEVTPYVSTTQSRTFYRNNCGAFGVSTPIDITIPAGTYFSYYSQADADNQALAWLNWYPQSEINRVGTCTYSYPNNEKSGYIRKNDCPTGSLGTSFFYVVPFGKYTSSISQADADAKALTDFNTDGQIKANTVGSCLYKSKALSNVGFRKNNCILPKVGSIVYYSAVAGTFTSFISQADADAKATAAGQANANSKGYCN